MSVTHNNQSPDEKQKRRLLSPEKKSQIFLESNAGKTPQESFWDGKESASETWRLSAGRREKDPPLWTGQPSPECTMW